MYVRFRMASDKILRILITILAALTIICIFTIYKLGFHSDFAAANILAREQLRTGQLLPDTWNTSTGIFLVFYNLLIVPFSLFIKDQLVLHSMAVSIVLLIFVFLLRYFSQKIVGSNFYLVVLCFFFSGTSSVVVAMAFAEAAYLISVLDNILLLTLFFKAVSNNFSVKSKKYYRLLLVYVAYLCLYGVLNLAYQVLPFLGSMVLFFILEHATIPSHQLKQEFSRTIKLIAFLLVSIVVGLLGANYLAEAVEFQSQANITYAGYSNQASAFVGFILTAIGYRGGVQLFSLPGLMNAVIIAAFLAMLICCIQLFRKYHEQSFEVKILMNFSLVIFCIYLYFDFLIYCTSVGAERYFFKPLFFLYILSGYYIYTYIFQKGFLSKIVAIVSIAIFSLPYAVAGIPTILNYPKIHNEQLGLVNYLKGNGLKHGYATFWNAGNNMVLSNFDIEIGGVLLQEYIVPYRWLSSDISYDPDSYTGESFLMLTDAEDEVFEKQIGFAVLGDPSQILSYDGFKIYVYPYNIAENDFYGRGYSNTEMIDTMVTSSEQMRQLDGTISISAGEVVYGPYITLPRGEYQIDIDFSEIGSEIYMRLTSDAGETLLSENTIKDIDYTVTYEALDDLENFEIVLSTNDLAILDSIRLTKLD